MLPGDIEDLIYRVPKGTQVRLINEPVKIGWSPAGVLEVQSYPIPETSPEELATRVEKTFASVTQVANERGVLVDYARLQSLIVNADGIPHPVTLTAAPFEVPYHFYDQVTLDPTLLSQLDASPMQPQKD